MADVSLHIHTNIRTYIHKYSDFLVVLISVGVTQARPNKEREFICGCYTVCMPLFVFLINCYNCFCASLFVYQFTLHSALSYKGTALSCGHALVLIARFFLYISLQKGDFRNIVR